MHQHSTRRIQSTRVNKVISQIEGIDTEFNRLAARKKRKQATYMKDIDRYCMARTQAVQRRTHFDKEEQHSMTSNLLPNAQQREQDDGNSRLPSEIKSCSNTQMTLDAKKHQTFNVHTQEILESIRPSNQQEQNQANW